MIERNNGMRSKNKGKNKGGRPRHQKTEQNRALINALAKTNWTQEQIAQEVGISVDTLQKYYRDEFDNGRKLAKYHIINSLFQKIEKGDTACIIFACKTILGMSEKQLIAHSVEERLPIIDVKFGK